jgi:ribosomal protein L24
MRAFAWTPIQKPNKKWNIVKDDFVEIISGKYKKQQGQVLRVHRKKNQVTVKGANLKFITVEDEEMQRRKKVV